MRRIFVALIVLSMAFALVGCGGTDETAETAETDEAAPVVAATTDPVEEVVDRSLLETGYPAQFPEVTNTEMPSAIQEKLDDGRPMAIFFYDDTEVVTKDQRTELDAALTEYRGLIDLVTYNLASAAGSTPSEDVQVAALLAADLGVSGTPYIIMVDGNGFVTWRFKGYVDRDVIGREVLRATE
ncbi:MAG: hypothetical protein JXE06_03465 [Coriobacteriia bacterium]|nr:hypothetical protein [Coriobacteriia bacterium]MBN2823548.1 hypothetical protein [Coriobacteriia bacterium]